MNTSLTGLIDAHAPTFSKGQRRIAAFITQHYDEAAFMTAARLGEEVGVSESTVVRFATELGFTGYPQLQKALQELIRGRLTSIQRIQASREQMDHQDILGSVMERDMESIHNAIERLDRSAFNSAVDKLLKAKHIYILGVRSSAYLAGYLHFYFHLIFPNVTLVQNMAGGEVFEQILDIGPGDVIFAMSFPRYSTNVINAVKYAHAQNAAVIALTDSMLSPIAKDAQHVLIAQSDMVSYVDSLVAPLSILNAILVAITKTQKERVTARFDKLERIWDEYEVYAKR
jgi:DNA-binding MurR/RpiR family transcriptional regulator